MAGWLRAARPLAHANIAPPILLGQAFAYASTQRFDWLLAAVALSFGVLDHLTIVFANDYADRDADALADSRTIFSGGSRVIPDGLIPPSHLRNAALVTAGSLLLGSAAAGWAVDRPLLPAFAGAALFLLYAYCFEPLRLSYRGFGEIVQGVGVGFVLPLLGWYAQTGDVGAAPFQAFAPLVLLAFASNILTALPDHDADRRADKRSWPVRRGAIKARGDALAFIGLGIALASQVGPHFTDIWTGVVLAPPALAALLALRWLKREDAAMRFVTLAIGAITLLHLTWTLALLLGESSARGGP